MMDWTDLLDTFDLGTLVPQEFDRYRPAIVDGLTFFLENLSPARMLGILAEQAAMPSDSGIDQRVVAIARHCPALHKLGQVLARDRRLPPRFRRLLQSLESMKPTQGLWRVRAALERELGPLARINISLDEAPLAEASVAIVVPFTGRDQRRGEPRRGVFKLLKSGIEQKLDEDLQLLQRVGALLDDRCHRYGIPEIDYAGTFGQVRELLRLEVKLDREQEHLTAARAAYAGRTSVIVPQVYSFSTPRVTAMERIDGRKVTDVGTMSAVARRDLAALIVEALIAHPIWSFGRSTLFHADPHAGNLLLTDDHRLALLDWSLVGYLRKHDQIRLSQILLGAVTLDTSQIARAISELAEGGIDANALRRVVDDGVRQVRQGTWPSLQWLTGLMDEVVTTARARFEPNLVIFRKVLQTLKGVVADVSEDCRADVVLTSSFLAKLGLECGCRIVAPPFSRAFSTHVSNVDLAHLFLSAPLIASRCWLGLHRDLLNARPSLAR